LTDVLVRKSLQSVSAAINLAVGGVVFVKIKKNWQESVVFQGVDKQQFGWYIVRRGEKFSDLPPEFRFQINHFNRIIH